METRERILQESRELLREKGSPGFSMRGLAERVGVTPTALYRHFEDKDALLATLLDEGFSVFSSYLMRALAGKSPLERLRRSGIAYFEFAREHPRDYALMFMTPCADLGLQSVSESAKARMDGTFLFLVDRIKECIDAGVCIPHEPRALALHVWATVHGLASIRLNGQLAELDEQAFGEHVEFTLDRIQAALAPPAAR